MFVAMLSAVITALACIIFHYQVLTRMSRLIPDGGRIALPNFMLLMAVVVAAHIAEIWIYAAAFYLLQAEWGIGHITGDFSGGFFDYVYFSAVTYTSLGLGDVWPHGPLRLVTAVEALNGLILIGWTVWFSYPIIRRGCRPAAREDE